MAKEKDYAAEIEVAMKELRSSGDSLPTRDVPLDQSHREAIEGIRIKLTPDGVKLEIMDPDAREDKIRDIGERYDHSKPNQKGTSKGGSTAKLSTDGLVRMTQQIDALTHEYASPGLENWRLICRWSRTRNDWEFAVMEGDDVVWDSPFSTLMLDGFASLMTYVEKTYKQRRTEAQELAKAQQGEG